jgi:hypothetical protein
VDQDGGLSIWNLGREGLSGPVDDDGRALVLTVAKGGIARINAFAGPELVAKFGFPPTV